MSITKEELILPEFDRKGLTERILQNENDRDTVVSWLMTDEYIMVYYHCFYILQDAAEREPSKFIKYWEQFAKLLAHKNSYHRDIAFTLIACCVRADTEHLFDELCSYYYEGIHDAKFKTAVSCIVGMGKIAECKPEQAGAVFDCLLRYREKSIFPEKQNEYIAGTVAAVFDRIMEFLQAEDKRKAEVFIYENRNSASPKTRQICKDIIRRRNLLMQTLSE